MNSKTWIFVGVGAFLVLGLGVGWHGLQLERESASSLAALDENRAQLSASLKEAQDRLVAHRRELAAAKDKQLEAAQAEEARLKAAQAEAKAKASAVATFARPVGKNPMQLMAADPQLRALHLKQFRANLIERFGATYQKLGLTQAQIDKFEDMATAHEDDRLSTFEAAEAQGISATNPGFEALRKQSIDHYYASLGTEVSPALSQEVIQLDTTRGRIGPVQALVNEANNLILPGRPTLTHAQSAQVAQILASDSTAYQSGGNADLNAVDWNRVHLQLAPIVSPSQLQAIHDMLQLRSISAKVKQFYAQPGR